jgi:cytochrome P450
MAVRGLPKEWATSDKMEVNVHAPSLFVPPRPAAPARELGLYRFLIAVRTNALQIWTQSAYEQDAVVESALGRTRLLINAPDAIHRVLVDNTANYCRTSATIRILRPIVGEGLLLSEGEDWRHQRRTIAPAMAPRVVPMMARHVSLATQETIAQLAALAARSPVDMLATVQFLALEIAARSMFSLEMRQYGAALRRLITRFAGSLGRPYFFAGGDSNPAGFRPDAIPVAMGRLHGRDHCGAALRAAS